MDLWHILVPAIVYHACNTNWDELETHAYYHELVRGIIGVHATALIKEEKMEFQFQNILDNLSLSMKPYYRRLIIW